MFHVFKKNAQLIAVNTDGVRSCAEVAARLRAKGWNNTNYYGSDCNTEDAAIKQAIAANTNFDTDLNAFLKFEYLRLKNIIDSGVLP